MSASEPTGQTPQSVTESVRCPFCGAADVELLALFGSQLLTDQYYCRACRTPFEHLRADAEETKECEASSPVGLERREE